MGAKPKKKLEIVPNGKGMYQIKFQGGGEVPEILSGLYTSHYFANRDIARYQS
jgi:hypothetical protein